MTKKKRKVVVEEEKINVGKQDNVMDWSLWLSKWNEPCHRCKESFKEGDTYGLHIPVPPKSMAPRGVGFFSGDRVRFMELAVPFHERCFDEYYGFDRRVGGTKERRKVWKQLREVICEGCNERLWDRYKRAEGWFPRDYYLYPLTSEKPRLMCHDCQLFKKHREMLEDEKRMIEEGKKDGII